MVLAAERDGPDCTLDRIGVELDTAVIEEPGLGRSKGGFTTKIHLRINGQGLPIAFALTGGEVSDFKGYLPIMDADGPAPRALLADKGYDADFIREDM